MSRTKLIMISIIAIAIISLFTFVGTQLYVAIQNAKALTIKVNSLQANLANAEADVTRLTDEIEFTELINKNLLKDRKLLSDIRNKSNQESRRLQNELEVANEKVKQIRVSKNENLKSWANTVMPNDAVSLLKYARAAGNYADSDNYQAGIHDATSRHAAILSAPNSF
ncbi:hypothetical protein [Rheinheimera salexigens]|nr:hypothetical protein [Rheinheimera salexigens]